MVNLFNSSVQTLCEKALLQYLNELDDLQQEAVCASTKELRQRIEIVQSICANNALRFTAYEKRLELQMGVVSDPDILTDTTKQLAGTQPHRARGQHA